MPSRAACLRCHELPWAPSGEAGDGAGKSWHSPPCSYSQQAGATPALESTSPGCTRPSLEEDTHSRAEVGATGCCGTVQHPNTTNVPAWLGLQALCPATWAVLQKPGCIHNTCPLVCHRGVQAAAPAENRDPPTPCLPPSHHGAILEHRNCHFGAGQPLLPDYGFHKARAEINLAKGGQELHPTGPPQGSSSRGVRAGCYQLPPGQGGSGWDRGQRLPQGRLRPAFNVHPDP